MMLKRALIATILILAFVPMVDYAIYQIYLVATQDYRCQESNSDTYVSVLMDDAGLSQKDFTVINADFLREVKKVVDSDSVSESRTIARENAWQQLYLSSEYDVTDKMMRVLSQYPLKPASRCSGINAMSHCYDSTIMCQFRVKETEEFLRSISKRSTKALRAVTFYYYHDDYYAVTSFSNDREFADVEYCVYKCDSSIRSFEPFSQYSFQSYNIGPLDFKEFISVYFWQIKSIKTLYKFPIIIAAEYAIVSGVYAIGYLVKRTRKNRAKL